MRPSNPPRLVIEPAAVVDADGVREGIALLCEDGRIAAIDRRGAFAETVVERRTGGDGTVAVPGLVNAHQHGRAVSTVALGVPDQPLETWIPALGGLPATDPYEETVRLASALVATGVTTTLHLHGADGADPGRYDADLRAVLSAYVKVGIRGVVAADVRDRGLPVYAARGGIPPGLPAETAKRLAAVGATCPPVETALEVVAGVLADVRAGAFGDVDLVLGPPGPPWCTDALLAKVANFASTHDVVVTTHLFETRYERAFSRRVHGESGTVTAFDRLGLLSQRLTAAHGVWLDEREQAALATAGATVVTNPASNLRLHAGIAPVRDMIATGVNIAIGTDNMSLDGDEDLLAELRLLRALHRRPEVDDPGISALQALAIATCNGGRAVGRGDIGRLRVGAPADVVIHDLGTSVPMGSPTGLGEAVVSLGSTRTVRTVVCAGHVVHEASSARRDNPPPSPPYRFHDEKIVDAARTASAAVDVYRDT